MLYYGPAEHALIPLFPRHDNVFITAHSPHLYLVNWPGTASAKVLMTNNLPSPVGQGMLADPAPEGSLSSLVLVRPPRSLLLDFRPEIFSQLISRKQLGV